MKESNTRANAAIFLLMPISRPVLVTHFDNFELIPPERGVEASYLFWIRVFCVAIVISITELAQLQAAIPVLWLNTRKVLIMSLFNSVICIAATIGLAHLIGHPVPFLYQMVAPARLISTVLGFVYFCGRIVRGNAQVQKDVKCLIVIC